MTQLKYVSIICSHQAHSSSSQWKLLGYFRADICIKFLLVCPKLPNNDGWRWQCYNFLSFESTHLFQFEIEPVVTIYIYSLSHCLNCGHISSTDFDVTKLSLKQKHFIKEDLIFLRGEKFPIWLYYSWGVVHYFVLC